MIRGALLAALIGAVAAPVQAQVQVASGQGAVLRGLDKLNGQTLDGELFSGGGRALMGLEVELADCRYPIDNPTGDAFAYLTIRESGKPEQVIEKMIVGRMKKFVAESTLLNQQFVVNPDLTVEAAAKEAGATVTGFVRVEVGEGIEVEKEDFAAEVAKAAQG